MTLLLEVDESEWDAPPAPFNGGWRCRLCKKEQGRWVWVMETGLPWAYCDKCFSDGLQIQSAGKFVGVKGLYRSPVKKFLR